MTTLNGPPPIPKPRKRRRILDGIVSVSCLIGIAAIFWTMRHGPSMIGMRDETAIAEAGVTNVVAALVTVIEDADVTNLRECFRDRDTLDRDSMQATVIHHSDIAYQLLRLGSRAPLDLTPMARAGLYQGYIDLGRDPWGQQFFIYFGPMAEETSQADTEGLWNFGDGEGSQGGTASDVPPGEAAPPPFVAWPGAHKEGATPKAVPAPGGLPFYVICAGPNGVLDQPFMNGGATPATGDDITSWDGYAWEVIRGNRE